LFLLYQSQVKHPLSNFSNRRIQSSYLLLDDDVGIQLLVYDVWRDFSDHFLKRYVLFKRWLEVHLQKGFSNLEGGEIKSL
jgi:hypothetical protein